MRVFQWVIAGLLMVLTSGLAYRQVFRGAEYTASDRRQNQRRQILPADRGIIYDREHRVLVGNRTCSTLLLNLRLLHEPVEPASDAAGEGGSPDHPERPPALAPTAVATIVERELARLTAVTGSRIQVNGPPLARQLIAAPAKPVVIADNLTEQAANAIRTKLSGSSPFYLRQSTERTYPHGRIAAHVLGRLRRELVRTPKGAEYPTLNYWRTVGDSGIEQQFEARLRGRVGEAVVRVDVLGVPIDPALERHDPDAGEAVVLSLDLDLQLAAERAMDATPGHPRGAAVAIAIQTGEMLAMASRPDFDLSAVSPVMTADLKRRIDAEGGWLNRATQGLYPPGSSFKIFTMCAGLRQGTLHPGDMVRCPGFYEIAGHRFVCHNPAGHGEISLREALAHSCNVFAYHVGLAAGPNALAQEARRFHFGEKTGVELPAETTRMLVPDPAGKPGDGRARWTVGDTINLSIGQGALRYTPLQAACAVASLARRETLTVPTLLLSPFRKPSGERSPEPLGLSDRDYAALIDGMKAVVESGIGLNAKVPGITMAGKSGTAQIPRPEGMANVAWFIAFAPIADPQIAVAVAMEGEQPGVEFAGAEHAAPIVREIVAAYFDKHPNR